MKIRSIEIETDLGRRVLQLSPPLEIDPTTEEMPPQFRSLTEMCWNVIRQVAIQGPELAATAPKAEA